MQELPNHGVMKKLHKLSCSTAVLSLSFVLIILYNPHRYASALWNTSYKCQAKQRVKGPVAFVNSVTGLQRPNIPLAKLTQASTQDST